MTPSQFLWLLAAAAALRGLGAGIITGLLLLLPLRRRMGLIPYAQVTRALYAGRGVRAYGALTILGVLLTALAAVAAYLRNEPAAVTWLLGVSLAGSTFGFVGTARNLPVMRVLWKTQDENELLLVKLLGRWERWHIIGAISHVTAFASLLGAWACL